MHCVCGLCCGLWAVGCALCVTVCGACGNCTVRRGHMQGRANSEIMGELRDRVSNGEFERVCESPNLGSGQPARQPADPDRPTELRNCPRGGGGGRPSVGALPPLLLALYVSSPSSRLRRPPSRGHTSQHPVETQESRQCCLSCCRLPRASP